MHEGGEPDSSLHRPAHVLARKLLALRVIVAEFEGAAHQLLHRNRLANHLADGKCLASVDEIPASEFIGRELELLRNFVHVSFKSENRLRSAEPAEGAVRRMISRYRLASDAHIR